MNPIHAKLKIYTNSLTVLSVICIALRLVCYLFAFDADLHYFSHSSPLPTIADAILILSLLWAASSVIFLPRTSLRPIMPAYSTATIFAVSLCGFILLFFSGRDAVTYLTGGFMPSSMLAYQRDLILHLITIISGLLAAGYFFTSLSPSGRKAGWHVLLGFFPVIWAVVKLAQVYFDFTHPMNEPSKVAVMLALITAMLALLQELRMLLDRHQPRLALLFHYFAVLLCGIGGISGVIACAAVPTLADYAEVFIVIAALWLYFTARTFDLIREQLAPASEATSDNAEPDESETAE